MLDRGSTDDIFAHSQFDNFMRNTDGHTKTCKWYLKKGMIGYPRGFVMDFIRRKSAC